jgi:hypothetical protein
MKNLIQSLKSYQGKGWVKIVDTQACHNYLVPSLSFPWVVLFFHNAFCYLSFKKIMES